MSDAASSETPRRRSTDAEPEPLMPRASDVAFSRAPKHRLSYATRLTISSSLIAFMTAAILSLMLVVVWAEELSMFAEDRLVQLADSSAMSLEQRYELVGEWNDRTLQGMTAISGITPGAWIVVNDVDGKEIYNDYEMKIKDPAIDITKLDYSGLIRFETSVVAEGKKVGTVRVTSMSRESIVPYETDFRENTYRAIIIASCVAVVLASIIGFVLTRDFVRPIAVMTDMVSEIKRGHLDVRTRMDDEDELGSLGHAMDTMAESLESARLYERQITTDVAHELRTPLMAMQATIEAMIDGVMDASPDRLSSLNSEVIRMGRLVDAQMRLSKLENRSTRVEVQKLDLAQSVSEITEMHSMLIEDSGLTLKTELQPDVIVLGDNDLLRQAVGNLISNAVRYTSAGGTISVFVRSEKRYANIEVRDTGIGLSSEDIAKVFQKFWRADSGRERSSGGLGIGLSVVKEIADLFHGWVDVKSIEGRGSSFTIVIPLYKTKKK